MHKGGEILLAGLVGRGIALSRTPAMHMAEGEAQGLHAAYRLLDADRLSQPLPALLDAAELMGFNGLNVTYPFKIDVLPLIDELSVNARAVGAVNTVAFRNGRRFGHNTDLWGFAEGFRRGLPDAARDHVLLLGAGGAGVAVAHALAGLGVAQLSIFDTDVQRAGALAEQVSAGGLGCDAVAVTDVAALMRAARPDGVVNATPMGMAKLPGTALDTGLLQPTMWVADIVYFPLETELLRAARSMGCRVLPGSGMAVFQAVRAFELFTGRVADPSRMKATFDAFDRPRGATQDTTI